VTLTLCLWRGVVRLSSQEWDEYDRVKIDMGYSRSSPATFPPNGDHNSPSGNEPFGLTPIEDDDPGFTPQGLLIVAGIFGGAFFMIFSVVALSIKCIEYQKARKRESESRSLLNDEQIN